jgi:two-component system sensor histidine kinase KdpD
MGADPGDLPVTAAIEEVTGLRRGQQDAGVAAGAAGERVVAAVTGGPEGETVLRRAARLAARLGADLLAVHVAGGAGLGGGDPGPVLGPQRALVESLGGTYHFVVGDDVPTALLDFARAQNATQLVVGTGTRNRLGLILSGPGVAATVARGAGGIDVQLVPHERVAPGRRLPSVGGGLSRRRRLAGFAAALVLPAALAVLSFTSHGVLNLSEVLLVLLAVVTVALVGGLWPALFAAVVGSLLLNYFFTPPLYTLSVAELDDLVALAVFVAVAVMVSSVVDLAARRTRQAARASAEAETLSVLAGSVLRGEQAVPALLDRVCETFSMRSAALLRRTETGRGWEVLDSTGPEPADAPEDGEVEVPVLDDVRLVLRGRPLPAADRRVLAAVAAHLAAALDRRRLALAAAEVEPIAAADRMRTALLAAVSHDLRTPIAAAKAAVTSLRSTDVAWDAEDRDELLATAEESLDRLTRLVDNLLDLSRLQAGVLSVFPRPVGLDEILPGALRESGAESAAEVAGLDGLPPVLADPVLLERVAVNLLANAARHSPAGAPITITGIALGSRVEVRVADRGPGISAEDQQRVFQPFQRLGDRTAGSGIGLGLALSRGLTEAMSGTLSMEQTPGGGLTMVLSLPAAAPDDSGRAADPVQRGGTG